MDIIVSIDADLFGTHPFAVRYAHDFAKRREATDGTMNRLYVVESCFTITGAMADHRLALRDGEIGTFLTRLNQELTATKPPTPQRPDHPAERFLRALAQDMRSHRGKCALVVGPRQPDMVGSGCLYLNNRFGRVNETFFPYNANCRHYSQQIGYKQIGAIESLASKISAGDVKTLLILSGNPAYDAPTDLQIADLLARVENTIHLGLYRNETARRCSWHLPQAHFLESWGDAMSDDGVDGVAQPMIEPLYAGKSAIELLALILDMERQGGRELVRDEFGKWLNDSDRDKRWPESAS